jgi:hypothetical protein
MKSPIRLLLLLLIVCALPAFAQVPPFGAPFPLANTRYGATSGKPLLRTDGKATFLFWGEKPLYVTRLIAGERHLGRLVLDNTIGEVDAVWIGDRFLVAGAVSRGSRIDIVGRFVTPDGKGDGDPFTIAQNARSPRLAFDGTTILMMYSASGANAVVLSRQGRFAGFVQRIGDGFLDLTAGRGRFAAVTTEGSGTQLVILDGTGRISLKRELSTRQDSWAVASDGERFLAVTNAPEPTAMLFEPNGNLVRTTGFTEKTSAVFSLIDTAWTGSTWAIFYDAGGNTVVELDQAAAGFTSRHQFPGTGGAITAFDFRVHAAWQDSTTLYATYLPVEADRIESVSYAAAKQELLAIASSADATLVVWKETIEGRATVYAGIRQRDGRWTERQIAQTGATSAIASSDGQRYVVILDGKTLLRLSATGILSPAEPKPSPFLTAQAIAWNGHTYGVFGQVSSGGYGMALLSTDGTWSDARLLMFPVPGCSWLASNGDGFFATCNTGANLPPLIGSPLGGVQGVRFDSDGRAAEPPIQFLRSESVIPVIGGIAYSGTRYIVAWNEAGNVMMAYGTSSSFGKRSIATGAEGLVSVTNASPGAWLGWTDTNGRYNIALVAYDGAFISPSIVDDDTTKPSVSRLATLTDGSVIRAFSSPRVEAPQYGEPHVMMQVGTFALSWAPHAPSLIVKKVADNARLEWTAPPELVNGYRLEYAINDGVWAELEGWFDADRHTANFPLPWSNVTYTFRVRAFNDAGASEYSQPASLILPPKRRAVR